MRKLRCPCGAKIKVRTVADYPGSKSGHVIYDHVPGPPCADFVKTVEEVTRRHGGKVVQKP